jgi:hypothetical protein
MPTLLPPQVIVALRHGEKPDDPGDHGLDAKGRARAQRLATILRPGGILPTYDEPTRFYVPFYADPPSQAHRAYQTVAPLATALGRPPTTPCPADRPDQLVAATLDTQVHTLVICWEHDALVGWLQGLAADAKAKVTVSGDGPLPSAWDGDDFDTLWLLVRRVGLPDTEYRLYVKSQAAFPPV